MKEDIPPYELISPYIHGQYTLLPDWLLLLPDLSTQAKIVYARLVRYAGKKEFAYPSQQRMASDLGMTYSNVRRCLAELRAYGLIWRRQVGFCKNNIYYFCNHPCRNERIEGVPEVFSSEQEQTHDDYDSIFNDTE